MTINSAVLYLFSVSMDLFSFALYVKGKLPNPVQGPAIFADLIERAPLMCRSAVQAKTVPEPVVMAAVTYSWRADEFLAFSLSQHHNFLGSG